MLRGLKSRSCFCWDLRGRIPTDWLLDTVAFGWLVGRALDLVTLTYKKVLLRQIGKIGKWTFTKCEMDPAGPNLFNTFEGGPEI